MKNQIIHISFANIEFNCPYCNLKHIDVDDRYLDKCNKNKSGYTKIKCSCGERFGMTYNFKGNVVGFKLITDLTKIKR